MNRKVWILIFLAACIVVAALVLYIFHSSPSSTSAPVQQIPFAQMNTETAQDNSAFAQALQLESQGMYTEAIAQLQSALHSTDDAIQTSDILSHLEQDYETTGQYANAIQTLQQIAGTSTYAPVTRAYAVEQMGLLYVRYPNASSTSDLFDQAPYENLYVTMNTNRTARNLFLYSTTIAPLPISEYYIAESYANSIFNQGLLQQASSTAQKAKLATLEQELVSSFRDGDTALAAITAKPPTSVYLLNAQAMRAVVLGSLQQVGNTSFGDATQAFQSVLTAYDSQNAGNDGSVRLQYAYFLANTYGTSRASDIRSVLAPIYQGQSRGGPITQNVLKGYIGAPATPTKTSLVLLSTIDPDFKTFLISLGWTSTDLSTSTSQ
jgi:tetratricopeptide (TPR) repeat protein